MSNGNIGVLPSAHDPNLWPHIVAETLQHEKAYIGERVLYYGPGSRKACSELAVVINATPTPEAICRTGIEIIPLRPIAGGPAEITNEERTA